MNSINTTIDDDDKTVKTSNCTKEKEENINLYDTHGLLDSGTTDHFLTITSNYSNVQKSATPIKIVIPDGNNMKSTQECDIDWPMLPIQAKTGRLVPSLKRQALILVVKLCNAGCDVIFAIIVA